MNRFRLAAAAVVVTASWAVVLFEWSCSTARPLARLPASAPQPRAGVATEESPKVRAAKTARAISADVERILAERGMPTEKAVKLARDSEAIFTALLTPDAEPYLTLMESRGARFAPFATELLESLRETCYGDIPSGRWGQSPPEQFRYAWEHPAGRGVEIAEVLPDSVESGLGMQVAAGRPDWPGSTFMAQYVTLERPRGRLTQINAPDFEKSGNCAWVQVRVRFTSGYRSRLRIISYFDADLGEWLPYLIAIEGIQGHVGYLLL